MNSIILYRFEDISKRGDVVMLRGITKKEEEEFDENEVFIDDKGNYINKSKVFFYGEINTKEETDRDIINRKGLVDDSLQHSWIPANFNYTFGTGEVNSWFPTADPVKWFQFCHCRIGKPKRVIAYRINVKLL